MSGVFYQLGGYAASATGTVVYYGLYGVGTMLLYGAKWGVAIAEYGFGHLPEAAAKIGRFFNASFHFTAPKIGTALKYSFWGAGKAISYIAPRTIPALRMTVGRAYQGASVIVEEGSKVLDEGFSKADQLVQTVITARTLAAVAFTYCAYKTLRGHGPREKLLHLAGAIVSLRVILG